jgi:prepilin peptidase CpaA
MSGMDYFLAFALIVCAVAAVIDFRTGEIPHWISLGPLALAPVAHFAWAAARHGRLMDGAQAAGFSILGALACGIVPLFFWWKRAFGGGDVKMLAALGAICMPFIGVEAELYAFIAAMIFAPARLAWEGKLLKVLGNTLALVVNPFLPKAKRRELSPEMMTSLRFGPAIFAGIAASAFMHWRGR